MDSYEVILSPKAEEQLNAYIDYIQYTLLSNQAAGEVWKDALETVKALESVAGSLQPCSNNRLAKLGYRSILFRRHKYVMLYRVQGKMAIIEGIYHLLQDYEGVFAREQMK